MLIFKSIEKGIFNGFICLQGDLANKCMDTVISVKWQEQAAALI